MLRKKYTSYVLIVTLGIVSLFSAATYAISGEAPSADMQKQEKPVSAEYIVNKMTIYLSLTDKQAQQIKPVIEEDMSKRSEILKNNNGDRDAVKSQLDALRLQTNNKLAQFLTDDQMKKMEEMQKTQQNKSGGRKGGTGRKKGFGKMGF